MKAIALDMDGTILNNRGEFTPRLVDTLKKVHEKGILVFFATGRTKGEILRVTPREVPLSGFVAASGMSIYNLEGDGYEKIASYHFERPVVEEVLAEARSREIYYETYTAESSSKTLKSDYDYSARDIGGPKPETLLDYEHTLLLQSLENEAQWVDQLNMDEILKIFFISKDVEKIDAWFDFLNEEKDRLGFALYKTSRHNSEIMLGGKDKGTGLETLADQYGISVKDIHAIGDSMNDLPLFEAAGKNTAMKNSVDSVIAAADDITEFSCDEDGLAKYLEKTYLH